MRSGGGALNTEKMHPACKLTDRCWCDVIVPNDQEREYWVQILALPLSSCDAISQTLWASISTSVK